MRFKKIKREKRRTLSAEITILNLITTICTLLLLGTAMLFIFFYHFFNKTREDMEYILKNTAQLFQNKVQFIEDGAITIRHNSKLQDFFLKNQNNAREVEKELTYCMELFSERNQVQQQAPFVRSVYLFNNNDVYIREHYYPMTVAASKEKEKRYQDLQQQFKVSGNQYQSVIGDEEINLCFRIYNDNMEEMGICIVGILKESVKLLFQEIESYRSSSWLVITDHNEVLLSYGDNRVVEELCNKMFTYCGSTSINGKSSLLISEQCGFGIRLVVAVGLNNVYTILKPTMFTFLAVFFLSLVLASTLSFGISYRFTRPLKKVTESLQAFGQENFDVRMEDFPIQEFHDMGVVFNEMAERINYLITQVYEKQILATQSQIKFLQSQINPHFQFNILAMLSIKAKIAQNEELYQCLVAFSKLMQGKIFREKEIKIPISEEIELIDFYLFLQNNRFHEKITYEITYGDEKVKGDLIPRLLIQPLVENAVSHGLEPKNGNGKIRVEVYEANEKLHIVVKDNGVGFNANELSVQEKSVNDRYKEIGHTHTGLENTKRLLRILYGEKYTMHILGKEGEGTRVEITLPIERGEKDVESNGG